MSAPSAIDLRSDTVTRPSPGMRAAIAAREVGDEFGDAPRSMNCKSHGHFWGRRAPCRASGSMPTCRALLHCRAGRVSRREGRTRLSRGCAASAIAGQLPTGGWRGGTFTVAESPPPQDWTRLSGDHLVCVENTHTAAVARWPRDYLASVRSGAGPGWPCIDRAG